MPIRQPPAKLRGEPWIRLRPESKRPRDGPKDAKPDKVILRWLCDGGNVGIALGRSDLVVIDADVMEVAQEAAERLPETFTVETGGDGFGLHLYYKCPQWAGNPTLADGDSSVRSDGYYAVMPPSIHPDGGKYRVARDIEIAEIAVPELEQLVNSLTEDTDTSVSRSKPRRANGDDLDELDELIHHDEKRADVRAALEDRDAAHNQRQFVAGFLLHVVGLSVAEVVQLIDRHNRWADYDPAITKRQVEGVQKSGGESR